MTRQNHRRKNAGGGTDRLVSKSQFTAPTVTLGVRYRRFAVLGFCVFYVGVSLWYGGRHLLGDSGSHPNAYFFTWDMFPGYATESSRRQFLGETQNGKVIRLLPDPSHHFYWGINGDVRRIDVDRRLANFRPALIQRVARYNTEHPDNLITRVTIVEQYWPAKFNLPDDLYHSTYGEPNPHRKYWRLINTTQVGKDGHPLPRKQSPADPI